MVALEKSLAQQRPKASDKAETFDHHHNLRLPNYVRPNPILRPRTRSVCRCYPTTAAAGQHLNKDKKPFLINYCNHLRSPNPLS